MPLFALLRLKVAVRNARFQHQLVVAVCVAAVALELADAGLDPVAAKLCFIIDAKILDVLQHLFPRGKVHDLFLSTRVRRSLQSRQVVLYLQLPYEYLRVARILIRNLVQDLSTVALRQVRCYLLLLL